MPLIGIFIDIYQSYHLLRAANNPSVELVSVDDFITNKGLDI